MSRIAPLIGALALTCSVAAVARTPLQPSAQASGSPFTEVNSSLPDTTADMQSGDITHCGPRDDIVAQLGTVFQEAPNGMGIIDPSAVVEVYVSDAGTFTILASGTNGTSCILASGEGWDGVTHVSGKGA